MFIAINENESWYLDDNIREHTTDPKGVNRTDFSSVTPEGIVVSMPVRGFGATNVKWSINGYIFGNMPLMKMKAGDRVRWYVATLGDFNNAHTPHWHGNTVIAAGRRTDVVSVLAAEMLQPIWSRTRQAFGCTTATSAITCSRGWWRATR